MWIQTPNETPPGAGAIPGRCARLARQAGDRDLKVPEGRRREAPQRRVRGDVEAGRGRFEGREDGDSKTWREGGMQDDAGIM